MHLNTYDNESCPVSVNEIAEIYLALQENLPEKIPSKDTLGFDAPEVVSAVRTLTGKHEKHLTAIDKAAPLTSFLINSMSFKNYSGRVALMTGLLFLKRSGYSFDGDALEESWPKGNDFESIKKWFGKVSIKAEGE